jgi:hypothetical protein
MAYPVFKTGTLTSPSRQLALPAVVAMGDGDMEPIDALRPLS